eukprot:Gregarina_sp_Poly_1__2201@NODE_1586_length_3777_cov_95_815633_g1047_i0_p1_GENE_NODE_1586_length_3777_cov_95_815633_g1047_i0NODE_1586_length_3777_cov_95_815633_g1047_i0_p1_ORF_typecomplete_len459_score63_82TehB/PF03848_14/3_2e05OSTbeta/PF15048_6/0_21DUF1968/PF09291_10/0_33Methyltransf_32/PF13679_6/3e03Methyltransf_32/PF13679_6/2_9e03Methyltransf_32/PF13679_6/2_2_NODE_1586_length_3777_cov_95_815633_g1047_i014842860
MKMASDVAVLDCRSPREPMGGKYAAICLDILISQNRFSELPPGNQALVVLVSISVVRHAIERGIISIRKRKRSSKEVYETDIKSGSETEETEAQEKKSENKETDPENETPSKETGLVEWQNRETDIVECEAEYDISKDKDFRDLVKSEFSYRGWTNVEVLVEESDQHKMKKLRELKREYLYRQPLWTVNPLLDFLVQTYGYTNGLSIKNFWEELPPEMEEVLNEGSAKTNKGINAIETNDTYSAECLSSPNQAKFLQSTSVSRRPVCVDLGSGVCRDCVALCRIGWDVLAVDRRDVLLSHGRRIARSFGIETYVVAVGIERDLGDGFSGSIPNKRYGRLLTLRSSISPDFSQFAKCRHWLERWRGDGDADVLHMSRFFLKGFLTKLFTIARSCVAVHHWVEGTAHPVHDRHILGRRQLQEAASASGWEVRLDDVHVYADANRQMRRLSMFVAVNKNNS